MPPTPLFALHTTLRPPSPADPRPHDLPAPHREAGDNQAATRHRVPSGAVPEGCTCLPRLPPPGSTPRSLPRTVTTSGPVPLTLLAPPPPAADSVACGARPISLCVARARRYVWGRRHVCARVCAHVCGLHTRACSGSYPCSREAEDGWTQVGLGGGRPSPHRYPELRTLAARPVPQRVGRRRLRTRAGRQRRSRGGTHATSPSAGAHGRADVTGRRHGSRMSRWPPAPVPVWGCTRCRGSRPWLG